MFILVCILFSFLGATPPANEDGGFQRQRLSGDAFDVVLEMRTEWPAGVAPRLRVRLIAKQEPIFDHEVIMMIDALEIRAASPGALVTLPVCGSDVRREVQVRLREVRTGDVAPIGNSLEAALSYRFVDRGIHSILKPAVDDDIDRILANMQPKIIVYGDEAVVHMQLHRTQIAALDGLAVGADVLLFKNDEFLAALPVCWLAGTNGDLAYPPARIAAGDLNQMSDRPGKYSIKLVSNPLNALSVDGADKYWVGVLSFNDVPIVALGG